MIYMFLSNYPSSGDINSSNLPCFSLIHFCSYVAYIANIMDLDQTAPSWEQSDQD